MVFTPWNTAHGEAAPITLQVAATVAISPPDDSVDTNDVTISGSGTIASFGHCTYHVIKRVTFKPIGGTKPQITLTESTQLNVLGKKDRVIINLSYGIYRCNADSNWIEVYFVDAGTPALADIYERLVALEAKVFNEP